MSSTADLFERARGRVQRRWSNRASGSRGDEAQLQGATSVRATRNPKILPRMSMDSLTRCDERTCPGLLVQDPPRNTRRLQSPAVTAEPSAGAPAWLSL